MKNYLTALALAAATFSAAAANLVGTQELANGKTVCIYSDGTTLVTSFNNCPSFK